jgi:2-iminobutanoate/2-iminopropanoate deaminase
MANHMQKKNDLKRSIHTNKAPEPSGVYSQGIVAGNYIFISGQLPINPQTKKPLDKDIKKQTRQVFKNIEKILATEDLGLINIVKISAFLLNLNDFKEMNEIFQEFFPENPPARTTTTVKEFPGDVLIEIDAIAIRNMK